MGEEDEFISLLSKPMSMYTPEDYKLYVKSLKLMPPVRPVKLKKPKPPYIVKISAKKKSLSLVVNRTPKSLSDAEMREISKSSGKTLAEIFIYMTKRGIIISNPK